MKGLFQLAEEVQEICKRNQWDFCFIGGLAVQRWGEPRLTVDIDLTLFTGFGREEVFIDELLKNYTGRRRDTKEFALMSRVLLLQSTDKIGIDIALGALPFEKKLMKRASYYEFLPGLKLLTCSAEDLIVLKSFAARPKDWLDVEGVIIRQDNKFDWGYIHKQLKPLCELKEAPEIMDKLNSLREDFT